MAKKRPATPEAKLAGRRVAFVGKFGYRDMWLDWFRSWAQAAGGAIVGPYEAPDYLVAGEGRGGKAPGDVAKARKAHPSVEVLDIAGFTRLVMPTAGDLEQVIRSGRQEHDYWETLDRMCWQGATSIDLSGRDLRKVDLSGAHLGGVNLDGADLRGANTHYTSFGNLRGAKLDQADAPNVYLRNLDGCSFRRANLGEAWLFYGNSDLVTGCDFTEAKMPGARAEDFQSAVRFFDCVFRGADLRDAKVERTEFERADFSGADLTRLHAHRARFDGANFAKARLGRADLRDASLVNADLRNADLREAVLSGADLTGANVEGADFAGAVLTGAKVSGLDASLAKNYPLPASRTVGSKVRELAALAAGSKRLETTVEIDVGKGHFARLVLAGGVRNGRPWADARSVSVHEGNEAFDCIACPDLERGMLNLADRWPNSTLRLDTVKASGSRTVRGQKLRDLAAAAWAEAFGLKGLTPEELSQKSQEQQAEALRRRDELMERVRTEGAKVWNSLDYRDRDRIDLRGIDLSGAHLAGLSFRSREAPGGRFAGANLAGAELWCSNFQGADFTGADLAGADLQHAKLQGADFTGAKLTTTKLKGAHYDASTKFPKGFRPPESMLWKGDGPRPGVVVKRAKPGSMDFSTFLGNLAAKVEVGRLDKAKQMLKAERFELFADVKGDLVAGVVRSQSDPDLVYSCRLCSDGRYGCCTQNLRPCGGLQGAPCKHLLVLIVGLAKAEKLDAATADAWVQASKARRPSLDREEMTATLLRYKGAEAGEVDWRPTETIPEDYYSF
jgi:uncharacterized protein YjbI with pentapeptide repeats